MTSEHAAAIRSLSRVRRDCSSDTAGGRNASLLAADWWTFRVASLLASSGYRVSKQKFVCDTIVI